MKRVINVILLRHGQTAYNADNRYTGTLDIPLSEQGRAALRTADFAPDVVYVSPLLRARQTARILFPLSRQQVIEDFREMCLGSFEGRTYLEMQGDAAYVAWLNSNCEIRCPGGETRAEFCQRTCQAFAQLMQEQIRQDQRQVVIVAHGGTQMAILERFARPHRDYYQWQAANGAGYLLQTTYRKWQREQVLRHIKNLCFAKE